MEYGAAPFIQRTPPNGSVYVRKGASDTNPGTSSQPVGTVSKALTLAPPDGTVVMFETPAPYTERDVYQIYNKVVTIQAAPGERPTFSGSDPFPSGWVVHSTSPAVWKNQNIVLNFDRTPATSTMLDPAHPEASWPERVVVGTNQPQLLRKTPVSRGGGTSNPTLAPDEYSYDATNKVMYVSHDPADNIRISTRSLCMSGAQHTSGQHPAFNLYGLRFQDWAVESKQFGAVRVYGHGSVVESCVWERCAAAGLFVQLGTGMQLLHNEYRQCGQLGLHGFRVENLEVAYSMIDDNNWDLYTTYQVAGGAKVDTGSHNQYVHHNLLRNNFGHAYWNDVASHGARYAYNMCVGNRAGAGLYGELSRDITMCGNLFVAQDSGAMVSEAHNCVIAYNTFVDVKNPIRAQRGQNPDLPGQPFTHPQTEYDIHSNLIAYTEVNPGAVAFSWQDPQGQVTWAEAQWEADYNVVRRVIGDTGIYATLTTDVYARMLLPTLTAYESMTGMGAHSVETTTEAPPALIAVQGAGRPMTELEQALLGVDDSEAAAPNVGWYGQEYVPDPPPPPPIEEPESLEEELHAIAERVGELEAELVEVRNDLETSHEQVMHFQNLLDEARAENHGLHISLQERDLLIADLQERIEELEAQIPAPLEDRIAPLLALKHGLGWSAQPGTLEAYAAVGVKMGCDGQSRRIYPTSDQNIEADVAAGRVPYINAPINMTDAQADAFALRVAALAPAPVMITIGHEEEHSSKGNLSGGFLAAYYRLFLRLEKAPNAVIGLTMMNSTLRLSNAYVGTTMDDVRRWLPAKGMIHFLGVDLYVQDTTNLPFSSIAKQTENAITFANELGVHLAYGEFAVAGTEEQRKTYAEQWCYTMLVWANENRPYSPLVTNWFNSNQGANVPTVFDGTKDWSIFKASDKADAKTPKVWKDFITIY